LLRNLGAPSPEALAAIREGVAEPSARAALTEQAVAHFVEQAAELCLSAYRSWDQCSPPARVHLRGFSLDLLAAVCDQVLRLDRCFRDFKLGELELRQAAERAAILKERNHALFEQARAILQMIAGPSVLPQHAAEASISSALIDIAAVCNELLQTGSATVRNRCQLYHLDSGYAQALLAAAHELSAAESKASDSSSILLKQAEVERLLDLLTPLLTHISQVFELARRFASGIPPVSRLETPQTPRLPGAPARPKMPSNRPPQAVGRHLAHDPRRVQKLAIGHPANTRTKR
jgi:hypothetical protein